MDPQRAQLITCKHFWRGRQQHSKPSKRDTKRSSIFKFQTHCLLVELNPFFQGFSNINCPMDAKVCERVSLVAGVDGQRLKYLRHQRLCGPVLMH